MTVERYLGYRGEIRAVAAIGATLAFVTAHPEGHAADLYRLDLDTLALVAEPLPGGGWAIVADGDTFWLAGGGQVYQSPASGGLPEPIGPGLGTSPVALTPLANGRHAV